ncbi:hypothetical protein MAPG_02016 [Magnaporthiopsis poae ATCC 64411]|uniref:Uncharacterized protein n=1 Tax=Magnaporthiopsis poae (strain ATCC 64411 / 73-15) TaxID=644358 RepID=A0A0C4DQ78_MAGP6|nr:hypothetical protein MAPG_02016 [Magnaporthiopsis poae ATCC 64411]
MQKLVLTGNQLKRLQTPPRRVTLARTAPAGARRHRLLGGKHACPTPDHGQGLILTVSFGVHSAANQQTCLNDAACARIREEGEMPAGLGGEPNRPVKRKEIKTRERERMGVSVHVCVVCFLGRLPGEMLDWSAMTKRGRKSQPACPLDVSQTLVPKRQLRAMGEVKIGG